MRRKPVTRDEVRFDGERITTLPADAIHQLAPIPRLWAPLLRQLNQVNKKEQEAGAEITAPRPRWRSERQCRRCGRMFYTAATRLRVSTTRYCSDHCVDAVARERHGKDNSRWGPATFGKTPSSTCRLQVCRLRRAAQLAAIQ